MTTVGRIELDVDADGRLLERRVRAIGKRGGQVAGREFGKAYTEGTLSAQTKKIIDEFRKTGKLSGSAFEQELQKRFRVAVDDIGKRLAAGLGDRQGFRNLVDELGGVSEAYERLNEDLRDGRELGAINDRQFKSLSLTLRNWAKSTAAGGAEQRALNRELAEQEAVVRRAREEYEQAIKVEERVANGREVSAIALRRLRLEEGRLAASRERNRNTSLKIALDFARNDFAVRKFELGLNKANESSGGFFSTWKTLPRGFRRFAFFTGLFASLAEEISILGSASGSSLAVLAGSLQRLFSAAAAGATILVGTLTAGAVGIGVIATAFRGFTGELEDLPPNARAAAKAFRDFGEVLGGIREVIQENFFDGIAAPLNALFESVAPILEAGLGRISSVLSDVFLDLIQRLSSDRGLGNLQRILEIIGASVGPLFTAFVNFGSALSEVFILSGPAIERFSGFLERITAQFEAFTQSREGRDEISAWLTRGQSLLKNFLDGVILLGGAFGNIFRAGSSTIDRFNERVFELIEEFNEWTGSLRGQNALREWLENGERVVKSVEGLVVALAKELDKLVDEEAVQRFEALFAALEEFAPTFGSILNTLGELNVFGVIADGLNSLLTPLRPLFDSLQPLAAFIRDLAFGTFDVLGAGLSLLSPFFGVLSTIFTTVNTVFSALLEQLSPFTDLFTELSTILNESVLIAAQEVGVAIGDLILSILGVDTSIGDFVGKNGPEIARTFREQIAPAIERAGDAIVGFIDFLRTDVVPFVKTVLIPGFNDFKNNLERFREVGSRVAGFFKPLLDTLREIGRALGIIPEARRILGNGGSIGSGGAGLVPFARGGLVTRPTASLTGEAGPEVVVPLTGPLSLVDPAARELSAIARGLRGTRGGGGNTFQTTIITPYADPENVAVSVVDEIASRVA